MTSQMTRTHGERSEVKGRGPVASDCYFDITREHDWRQSDLFSNFKAAPNSVLNIFFGFFERPPLTHATRDDWTFRDEHAVFILINIYSKSHICITILTNTKFHLQRDIPMLLPGIRVLLGRKHFQC